MAPKRLKERALKNGRLTFQIVTGIREGNYSIKNNLSVIMRYLVSKDKSTAKARRAYGMEIALESKGSHKRLLKLSEFPADFGPDEKAGYLTGLCGGQRLWKINSSEHAILREHNLEACALPARGLVFLPQNLSPEEKAELMREAPPTPKVSSPPPPMPIFEFGPDEDGLSRGHDCSARVGQGFFPDASTIIPGFHVLSDEQCRELAERLSGNSTDVHTEEEAPVQPNI